MEPWTCSYVVTHVNSSDSFIAVVSEAKLDRNYHHCKKWKNIASQHQIEIFPCAFDHCIQTLSGSLSTDPIFHGFNVRTAIKTYTTISQFAELLLPGSNLCFMELKLQHQISEDVQNRRLGCFNGTYMQISVFIAPLWLCRMYSFNLKTGRTYTRSSVGFCALAPSQHQVLPGQVLIMHLAGRLPSCNALEGQREGVNFRIFLCVSPLEKFGKQTKISDVGDKKWTNYLLPGHIRLVAQSRSHLFRPSDLTRRLQASRRVWWKRCSSILYIENVKVLQNRCNCARFRHESRVCGLKLCKGCILILDLFGCPWHSTCTCSCFTWTATLKTHFLFLSKSYVL